MKHRALRLGKDAYWLYPAVILLLCYTVLRAINVPFSIDESSSFLGAIQSDFGAIWNYTWEDANNHLLNSILARISYLTLGDEEWALRLPNLIAHVIYLWFSYRFVRRLTTNSMFRLAAFMLLNVNPYLLEFFGACRGYGLQCAALMVGIYWLHRFWVDGTYRSLISAFGAGVIAVLCQFTSIYFFGGMGVVVLLYMIWNRKKEQQNFIRRFYYMLIAWVSLGILVMAVGEQVIRLQNLDKFYWGVDGPFFEHSLFSVLHHITMGRHNTILILIILTICLVVMILALGYRTYRDVRQPKQHATTALLILFLVSLFGPLLQHYALGSLLPLERTGLYLYPIFASLAAAFLCLDCRYVRIKSLRRISLLTGATLSCFLTFQNLNQEYFFDWPEDKGARDLHSFMMTYQQRRGEPVKIGLDWRYWSTSLYYLERNPNDQIILIGGNVGDGEIYVVRDHIPEENPTSQQLAYCGAFENSKANIYLDTTYNPQLVANCSPLLDQEIWTRVVQHDSDPSASPGGLAP